MVVQACSPSCEGGLSRLRPVWAKSTIPYLKNNESKNDWRFGSSSREPALQVQDRVQNSSNVKKKNHKVVLRGWRKKSISSCYLTGPGFQFEVMKNYVNMLTPVNATLQTVKMVNMCMCLRVCVCVCVCVLQLIKPCGIFLENVNLQISESFLTSFMGLLKDVRFLSIFLSFINFFIHCISFDKWDLLYNCLLLLKDYLRLCFLLLLIYYTCSWLLYINQTLKPFLLARHGGACLIPELGRQR
jgi:hypothetical protein